MFLYVIYVRFIRDVDDKISKLANKNKISFSVLTKKITESFNEDCIYLSKMETYTPNAGMPNNVCNCADIHMVANRSEETSVSIHVYPKDIDECQVFEPINLAENIYSRKKINLSYSK